MATSVVEGKAAAGLVLTRLHALGLLPRIVDIGPGCGSYRHLLGAVLPGTEWVAVEIWGPYVQTHGLTSLYDMVYVSDVRCFDFSVVPEGGAAILGDVLEHIGRADALKSVARALDSMTFAILSVPTGLWPQGEVGGNPWEAHVETWSVDSLHSSFAPVLAGTIDFHYSEHQGISTVFLAKSGEHRTLLKSIVAECGKLVVNNPGIVNPGLGWCPNYADPAVQNRFQAAIRGRSSTGPAIQSGPIGVW